MPLDTQDEGAVRRLDRFREPVELCSARRAKPVTELTNGLVVVARDRVQLRSRRARHERARLELDRVVHAVEASDHPPVRVATLLVREALDESAPEGHVQDLHAAADAEERQVALHGRSDHGDLESVPLGVGALRRRIALGAVGRGVHVGAADRQQAVEPLEDRGGMSGIDGQDHRQRPGGLHGGHVAVGDQVGGLAPEGPARFLAHGADPDQRSA